MAIFADVQYCVYADQVGGVQKGQKYADVIKGWPLRMHCIGLIKKKKCDRCNLKKKNFCDVVKKVSYTSIVFIKFDF